MTEYRQVACETPTETIARYERALRAISRSTLTGTTYGDWVQSVCDDVLEGYEAECPTCGTDVHEGARASTRTRNDDMTTKAREYRDEALHAAAEIAREYFANEAPSVGAPWCWPDMPDDFVPASDVEAVPLEYIELTVPGCGTFLAILTRIPVEGGPGRKFYVKPIGGS